MRPANEDAVYRISAVKRPDLPVGKRGSCLARQERANSSAPLNCIKTHWHVHKPGWQRALAMQTSQTNSGLGVDTDAVSIRCSAVTVTERDMHPILRMCVCLPPTINFSYMFATIIQPQSLHETKDRAHVMNTLVKCDSTGQLSTPQMSRIAVRQLSEVMSTASNTLTDSIQSSRNQVCNAKIILSATRIRYPQQ